MKNILVSLPNQHWIHTTVAHTAIKLLCDKRHNVQVTMPSHKPYVNNLHHIVNEFMAGEYDFWLNIDADNPPSKNPLDLVSLDKDIIGLPTPIWHYTRNKEYPIYFNGYDYASELDAYRQHTPMEGLQRVDAIGTGCFLVSRRVFLNPEMRKAPFARKWNEDGTMDKGNDISFCERARGHGFEIYCHYDYPCSHFNELELTEVIRAFREIE